MSLAAWIRALERTTPISNGAGKTLGTTVADLGPGDGDRPALVSDGEALSYSALTARARRIGRWALDQALEPGDTVCLLMPNRPEYVAIWLGISEVRGVVALLNT